MKLVKNSWNRYHLLNLSYCTCKDIRKNPGCLFTIKGFLWRIHQLEDHLKEKGMIESIVNSLVTFCDIISNNLNHQSTYSLSGIYQVFFNNFQSFFHMKVLCFWDIIKDMKQIKYCLFFIDLKKISYDWIVSKNDVFKTFNAALILARVKVSEKIAECPSRI